MKDKHILSFDGNQIRSHRKYTISNLLMIKYSSLSQQIPEWNGDLHSLYVIAN